jgi:nitroreductase
MSAKSAPRAEVIATLARRRTSTRRFKTENISLRLVIDILEVARQAPSGANKQPWRFLIISSTRLKGKVRAACEEGEREFHSKAPRWMKRWMRKNKITPSKPFLTEAPYLIVVCSDTRAPYHVQSTWISIGFMLLAIEEMGLGTLTYTPSDTSALRRVLKIPKEFSLEAVLPIGIPAESKAKSRRGLRNLVYLNAWNRGRLEPKTEKSRFKRYKRKFLR